MKILIVHPGGTISDNPSLRSIITSFRKRSYDITIWRRGSWSNDYYIPDISYVEDHKAWWLVKAFFINHLCSRYILKLIGFIEKKRWNNLEFDLLISIDRHGVIEGNFLTSVIKRHIHFSYEIFFESETSVRYKETERSCYHRVELLVIQDKKRAEIFEKENKIILPIFLLPVSGGAFNFHNTNQKKLGKHILALGSLADWTMIPDLIDCVINDEISIPVILHGRYGALPKQLEERIRGNNYLKISSKHFTDEQKFYEFVTQAYAGYAMYKPIKGNKYLGKNIEDLGLSSGKISTFLSCGVPVITNITGEFASLIKEYKAGIVISEAHEIPYAIELISKSREQFSIGAKQLFKEKLSFNLYEQKLMNIISDMKPN
jgi:glycosyltransferase involved in cell wall biosynthesis